MICGLDSSTKTGICVLSPTLNMVYHKVIKSKHKGLKEAERIALQCSDVCLRYQVQYVFLEGLAWGVRNKIVLDLLVQINVLIRYELGKYCQVFLVPPLTLKKYITDNGRATKKQISVSLKRHWNIWHKNDNVRDAIGLALCGYGFLQGYKSPWGYSLHGKITPVL